MDNEIVGAKIGSMTTSDLRKIHAAIVRGIDVELLTRQRMEFMDVLDLGQNWSDMAAAPTLFLVDDGGNIVDGIGQLFEEPVQSST